MPCERKSPFTTRRRISTTFPAFRRVHSHTKRKKPTLTVKTNKIQPTSHTENLFPLIGPELPERWRTMRLGKDDLEDL